MNFRLFLAYLNVICALLNIPLRIMQCVESWYIDGVVGLLNITIYYWEGDYYRCLSRVFFFFTSCYGAYKWTAKKDSKEVLMITQTSWRLRGKLLLAGGVLWASIYGLSYYIDIWLNLGLKSLPINTLLTTLVFIGQWLTAHKKLESHLFWFLYNILSFYYHTKASYQILKFKYLIFAPLSLYGLFVWTKKHKEQKHAHQAKSQGATLPS